MIKGLLIYVLIIFQISILSAQKSDFRDPKQQIESGKKFYTEIYVLPDNAPDSTTIFLLYRVTYQTLTFIRSNSNGRGDFLSVPDIEVEFKDSDGIIRKRIFREDSIYVNSFEESVSSKDYIYGFLSTKMKTGKYTVSDYLRCANTQLSKTKVFPLVECHDFNKEKTIAEPIITSLYEPDQSNSVKPYILDLGIPFSSEGFSIILPVSYDNEFEKFNYSIKFIKSKDKNFNWGEGLSLSGSVIPLKNTSVNINFTDPKTSPTILLNTLSNQTGSIKQGLINIVISSDNLVPGQYELKVVRNNTTDTLKRIIDVVWEDMPMVLVNPDYAADAMYYILTDEQYDKMKDGNSQEVSKKILDYWKVKDPTKNTAYNEAMAEYFKRVDYAMINFRTLSAKDGVKTDKGKIYILYGPPTKTDKVLGEKKNKETWRYDKLKKEFVFETDIKGNYILIKINDLK